MHQYTQPIYVSDDHVHANVLNVFRCPWLSTFIRFSLDHGPDKEKMRCNDNDNEDDDCSLFVGVDFAKTWRIEK